MVWESLKTLESSCSLVILLPCQGPFSRLKELPITFEAESGASVGMWEGKQVSRSQGGGTGAWHSPAPPRPGYTTTEKSLLASDSSFTQKNQDLPSRFTMQHSRKCECVLKSTKSQINVRICMIIEKAIGCPHENRGNVELWSPLFIADSSGRRPEV